MTLRVIFHSTFLAVRTLIIFNVVHLNNPCKRLPRMYEKRRVTWFSASKSSSRTRKNSSPGIFGTTPIYILCTTRPFRIAHLLYSSFFYLLSLLHFLPQSRKCHIFLITNHDHHAKRDFAVRESIILLCYILFAALSRSVKNTFISLLPLMSHVFFSLRFFFKNKQEKKIKKKKKIYK